MSEDGRMAIFDAAAFALAFFGTPEKHRAQPASAAVPQVCDDAG
jgi:hypothetical protein